MLIIFIHFTTTENNVYTAKETGDPNQNANRFLEGVNKKIDNITCHSATTTKCEFFNKVVV